MKIRCNRCDAVGDCSIQKRSDEVVLSFMLPYGWNVQTRTYGGMVSVEVICYHCIIKEATHHESWKDGILP